MNKKQYLINLLLAVLVLAPLSCVVRANPEKTKVVFTMPKSSLAAPIGSVESLSAITVNGQLKRQQELLWNGDVVQAATSNSARVILTAIGTLTLRGGAVVKIQADAQQEILTASVLEGEVNIALKPNATAKITVGDEAFVAAKGAQFRAGWRAEQAVIDAQQGDVLALGKWSAKIPMNGAVATEITQQTAPRKYLIKPMNLGTNTEIRARSTRNIQVRVTDENDRPVPDVPVLFLIGGAAAGAGGGAGAGASASSVGSFAGQASSQVTTNAQGVAQVNFTAANAPNTPVNITASVPGTNASLEMAFRIISAPSGFWTPHNAVPILAIVGAAVGFGIYKAVNRAPLPTTPDIIRNPNGGTIIP